MKQNKSDNIKIIGITGGIATGKSTVSKLLLQYGFVVIDSDTIAREVVDIDMPAYKDIVKEFGEGILNKDSTINRKKLGDIIFQDKKKRLLLNEIVHPRIFVKIKNEINFYANDNDVIFIDMPLLIEELENLEKYKIKIHEIWLVYVQKNIQVKRLMQRDYIDLNKAIAKLDSQMLIDKKVKYADVIIDNSKDIRSLSNKIEELIRKI